MQKKTIISLFPHSQRRSSPLLSLFIYALFPISIAERQRSLCPLFKYRFYREFNAMFSNTCSSILNLTLILFRKWKEEEIKLWIQLKSSLFDLPTSTHSHVLAQRKYNTIFVRFYLPLFFVYCFEIYYTICCQLKIHLFDLFGKCDWYSWICLLFCGTVIMKVEHNWRKQITSNICDLHLDIAQSAHIIGAHVLLDWIG